MSNVIEATILTGPFKDQCVLIPRIPMIPTDIPFQFRRLQLPIRLAFAMTINKAQGQTFDWCGLDLQTDCFAHFNCMLHAPGLARRTICTSTQTVQHRATATRSRVQLVTDKKNRDQVLGFKSSGMLDCVTGQLVPNIWKAHA
jgi:hypothetical protein